MRKYTDTQVLDEVIREARRLIRYNTKERNKESEKKIKLIAKRERLEKKFDGLGDFRLDGHHTTMQFMMIEGMIRYHNSVIEANEKILEIVKKYRYELKSKIKLPKGLPIDEDLFVLTKTPLDHNNTPVIAISGLVRVTKPQQELLLKLLMTMVDGVEPKLKKGIKFEKSKKRGH